MAGPKLVEPDVVRAIDRRRDQPDVAVLVRRAPSGTRDGLVTVQPHLTPGPQELQARSELAGILEQRPGPALGLVDRHRTGRALFPLILCHAHLGVVR